MEIDGNKGRLILRNDGFAAPLNPRRVSFAWYDSNKRETVGTPVSETRSLVDWQPGPQEIVIPFELPPAATGLIPAVRFADDSDALADDGRHAIRVAGLRFDETTGWNLLG